MTEKNRGILLNVGCRAGKNPNWVGIDSRPRLGVDILHDLESFPYPFEDSSCISIAAAHVVEHIHPVKFIPWMNEMWRLLKPDGQLAISCPYAGSVGFWSDPTHVNGVNENTFKYFDPSEVAYMEYTPNPWRIEQLVFRAGSNIEVLMRKRTFEVDRVSVLAGQSIVIGAIQKLTELSAFYSFIDGNRMDTVVEIGTANGGVLFGLCALASDKAKIASIDLPGGKFGGGYTEEATKRFRGFAREKQRMTFIREDSHKESTLERLKGFLKGDRVDLLFIDGDHTYEGVKKDWEMYSPLVRKGGVIGFHDICHHPHVPDCKVDKFWKEVKKGKKAKEFIDKDNPFWGGIGVITV